MAHGVLGVLGLRVMPVVEEVSRVEVGHVITHHSQDPVTRVKEIPLGQINAILSCVLVKIDSYFLMFFIFKANPFSIKLL